ncbi:hypothetical protein BDB00DRAFT_935661 [Zychaea mexicana]|uniref:uncharacterized protein n=1 Tax=Zychaea mexicana TaxID=64656 RepID=UPI0022FE8C7C|nr:uncharacterized protein BDB00DRAFT_935661 [Zychaea mexicana]KAI9498500.1 hypothetical protein BDB00DRAFT_935661 [Zychaea mexicana]
MEPQNQQQIQSQETPEQLQPKRYSNCKSYRPLLFFVGNRQDYNTCRKCHQSQSDVGKPIAEQLLLTVDEVLELIPSRQNLRNVADSLEDYSLDAYVQLDDDMLALSDSQLVINIRDCIQAVDGYHYYEAYRTEPRRKFGYSFLFRCSQDFHVQDQAAVRLRLYRRMPTFLCNGRISGMVGRVNGYFHLNIEHSCGHEAAPAVENNAVPQNVRAYIAANAIDLDAQQLHLSTRSDKNNAGASVLLGVPVNLRPIYTARHQFRSAETLVGRAADKGVRKIFTSAQNNRYREDISMDTARE